MLSGRDVSERAVLTTELKPVIVEVLGKSV